MAYIEYVDDEDYVSEMRGARDTLANILRIHGIEPEIGRAHLGLYRTSMFGPSRVSRLEREAIAVAVSAANRCHY